MWTVLNYTVHCGKSLANTWYPNIWHKDLVKIFPKYLANN